MDSEVIVRLGIFLGIFATMALWEVAAPRRRLNFHKYRRWLANGLVFLLDVLVVQERMVALNFQLPPPCHYGARHFFARNGVDVNEI